MSTADRFDPKERAGVTIRVLYGVPGPVPTDLQSVVTAATDVNGRHIGWDLDMGAVFNMNRPAVVPAFARWRNNFELVRHVPSQRLWDRFCAYAASAGATSFTELNPPVTIDSEAVPSFVADIGMLRRRLLTGPGGWVLVDTRSMAAVRSASPVAAETVASGPGWHLQWEPVRGLVVSGTEDRFEVAGWEMSAAGVKVFDIDDRERDVPADLAACLTVMAPAASEVAVAPAGPEKVFGPVMVALADCFELAATHRVPVRIFTDAEVPITP